MSIRIPYINRLPFWDHSVSTRLAWIFILFIALLAILGPFIANEKPYFCKLEGRNYFPLFSGISESTLSLLHPAHSPVDWHGTKFETVLYAPIPYSHYTIDLKAGRHVSPFDRQPPPLRFRHWLGTDVLGRDVAAGLIRGCRISLLIGFGSMFIALLLGVPLGSVGAYVGNRKWKVTVIQLLIGIVLFFVLIYLMWLSISPALKLIWLIALTGLGWLMIFLFGKIKSKRISVPLDQLVISVISVIDSFPGLFIILVILFIVPVKGWVVVMGAIALLRWPVMARYMRAEVYKLKESNYIKAAQITNLPSFRILSHHIIPYAFRPVMISFVFGVSSAILAESSLSFLGIGLPVEEVNWGRLLSQARNHFDAWWLVLFPGAAIFFTLLSLYTIGNAMEKSLEHEQRTSS